MRSPSALAVATALLLVVATMPLSIAWAFATDDRWAWVANGAPLVAAAYGWGRGRRDRTPVRDWLLPMLVWAWLASLGTSAGLLVLT